MERQCGKTPDPLTQGVRTRQRTGSCPAGLEHFGRGLSHPVAGSSWEGFVVEQLIAAAPTAQASFYRTSNGAEVDLVLEFRSGQVWVFEIKRSSAPTVSRGFYVAAADVGATRKLLIAPVEQAYPMKDGIEVMNPLMASLAVSSQK